MKSCIQAAHLGPRPLEEPDKVSRGVKDIDELVQRCVRLTAVEDDLLDTGLLAEAIYAPYGRIEAVGWKVDGAGHSTSSPVGSAYIN